MSGCPAYVFVVAALALAAASGCASSFPVLPAEFDGWRAEGEPQRVTKDNLFEYMNGAGELYLAYGLRELMVWNYASDARGGILVEVYDMGRPEDAFGVLSQDLDGEDVGIGAHSVYGFGLLRFIKGPYFARILADEDSPEAKRVVLDIGKRIASQISAESAMPDLLDALPAEGRVAKSVHYFHTRMCLNFLYFIAEENILGLSHETEAVLCDYKLSGGGLKLLAVRYPGAADARRAWQQFQTDYLESDSPVDGLCVAPVEDGKWVGGAPKDRMLFLVFEAQERGVCEGFLKQTARQK